MLQTNTPTILLNKENNAYYEREIEITNPQTKEVTKELWRSVMIEQLVEVLEGGILDFKRRIAFVTLKPLAWKKYGSSIVAGKPFPISGKIYVHESTATPKNPKKQPKWNPSTQMVMKHQGLPIFRDNIFTSDHSKQDILLVADTASAPAISDDAGNTPE